LQPSCWRLKPGKNHDPGKQRWPLDFAADVLSWGRRFRVLTVVDEFTREALALVVDSSIGGRRVVRELDALIARRRRPAMIVIDNGTELTSRAPCWNGRTGLAPRGTASRLASQPGTPWSRASSADSATSA
jgi:transposase InsO family protein